jgi:hypothetical protein
MSTTIVRGRPVELLENGTWAYLSAKGSALERLQKAQLSRETVDLFRGLFKKAGLDVVDTGEKITCTFAGDGLKFELGSDDAELQFHVKLYSYQVDWLVENAKTGFEGPLSRFRLVREILKALPTQSRGLLDNSFVTNATFRKLIHSKDLMHLYLVSPDQNEEEDSTFTFFFVNGRWNLAAGLAGRPDRVFRMTSDDAFDLLRYGFGATQAGPLDLAKLAAWYVGWRQKVEVAA